ncbi:hypothetical protein ACWJKU_11355 [Methylocaldum sp. MU1018]
MSKHLGHDHLSGNRFQIVDLDSTANTVTIRYAPNAWMPGAEPTQRMSWTDFVRHLINGHFEIYRGT